MRRHGGFARQGIRHAPGAGVLLLALLMATPAAAEGLRLPFLGSSPVLDLSPPSEGESERAGEDDSSAAAEVEGAAPGDDESRPTPPGSDSASDGADAADEEPAESDVSSSRGEGSTTSLIGLACSLHFRNGENESLLAEPRISTLSGLEVTITAGRDAPEDVPIYEASFQVERLNGSWRLEGGAMARSRAGGLIAQTTYRQSGEWEEPIDLLLHLPAGERGFQLRCVATQH